MFTVTKGGRYLVTLRFAKKDCEFYETVNQAKESNVNNDIGEFMSSWSSRFPLAKFTTLFTYIQRVTKLLFVGRRFLNRDL